MTGPSRSRDAAADMSGYAGVADPLKKEMASSPPPDRPDQRGQAGDKRGQTNQRGLREGNHLRLLICPSRLFHICSGLSRKRTLYAYDEVGLGSARPAAAPPSSS